MGDTSLGLILTDADLKCNKRVASDEILLNDVAKHFAILAEGRLGIT